MMYASNLWYLLYYSPTLTASASMHVCVSLSCDCLSDFLKGYRAPVSFWHLITVRSHCAPADPFWYGPCTCPSPLSQVPIIIIKTLPPHPHSPPPAPAAISTPTPEGARWFHISCIEKEEFNQAAFFDPYKHSSFALFTIFDSYV